MPHPSSRGRKATLGYTMTTATQPGTARLSYNRTIGVAAMQGRGFYYPWSATVADDGKIFVLGRGSDSDPRGVRVTVMNLEEEYFGTFGSFGTGSGQAIWNASIAIDSQQRIFTSDDHLNRIMVRTLEGELLDTWGQSGTGEGQMNGPNGIAFNSNDELLVSDHLSGRIQKFTASGQHIMTFGEFGSGNGQLNLPWEIFVDTDDNVFVSDWGNDRIVKFSSDGEFLANFGSSGRGFGEFEFPCEGGFFPLDTDFFHVAILTPLAANWIVVFKGETQGIDLGMATSAALEFLMLEYCLTDGGGAADVRLVDHHIGRWLDVFVVKIL